MAVSSPVGRTQPAPSMTAESRQVRFASASCQNYQDGFYTAHADIAVGLAPGQHQPAVAENQVVARHHSHPLRLK
jgi:hypothetical protein